MTFEVIVAVNGSVKVTVDAEDEKEARRKANEQIYDMDFGALTNIEWDAAWAEETSKSEAKDPDAALTYAFCIYQLSDKVQLYGNAVNPKHLPRDAYIMVWADCTEAHTLPDLIEKFNANPPVAFRGKKLGPTDIVEFFCFNNNSRKGIERLFRSYIDGDKNIPCEWADLVAVQTGVSAPNAQIKIAEAITSKEHLYEVSADDGESWTMQWLTDEEIAEELTAGHIVRPA